MKPQRVAVDLRGQLPKAEAALAVDQGLGLAEAHRPVIDQAGNGAPDQIGPGIFLPSGRTADARPRAVPLWFAHGCWLLTEMTSPLMYDE